MEVIMGTIDGTQEQERKPQMGLTFQDVWAALMESDLKFEKNKEEHDRMFAERDQEFQKSKKEHDRMCEKYDRMFEEHEQRSKENAQMLKELADERKHRAAELKELQRQTGGLHKSFGDLAEHLVAPGVVKKFNALGYHFKTVVGRKSIYDDQGNVLTEIDLLLENGQYSIAVEVKARPKENDIPDHIDRLQILRQEKNQHGDTRRILGAMAGAIFPDTVKKAALKAGLYVLTQAGDTMNLDKPEWFSPSEW
jgi:hypothetical protein